MIERELELARTRAVRSFLPFVRSLLTGRPPSKPPGRLPMRHPDALTAEVVTALEDMVGKSVGRWLFAGLGWRQRPITDPEDDEEVLTVRLWEEDAWGDLRLRYSAESVDALLLAWNTNARTEDVPYAARQRRKKRSSNRRNVRESERRGALDRNRASDIARLQKLSLKANGDVLLHHLAFRPQRYNIERSLIDAWLHSPLNQMAYYALGEAPTENIPRLLSPDLRPLLPWIVSEWPAIWRQHRGTLFQSASRFSAVKRHQAACWTEWIRIVRAEARPDLLVPLVEGYRNELRHAQRDLRQLNGLIKEMRLSERQAFRDTWARALAPLQQLRDAWQQAHARHPIDRLGPDKIFLNATAESNLPRLAEVGADLARELRGEIG